MNEKKVWSNAGWVPMQAWRDLEEEPTGVSWKLPRSLDGWGINPIYPLSASLLSTRWSMLIPAFLTHACLGAPYGWSAVTAALTREQVGCEG